MTEQLLLLDFTPVVATSGAPRCRMCARLARWVSGAEEWGMYCAGRSCSNRDRLCQCCGGSFVVHANGAGTKYCSADCKRLGRNPEHADIPPTHCAWCGKRSPYVSRHRVTRWPYVCTPCVEPIKYVVDRLRSHNVPHERARRLLTDPGCEICGTNLLTKVRTSNNKVQARLVVDHDHQCCPVESHSCGKCVRGLICRACNAAAGQLYDSPKAARALAAYLDRWHASRHSAEGEQ